MTEPINDARARDSNGRREQDLQCHAVVDASVDGFCMVDMRGRFVEVNSAFVRLTGYSREELQGMNIDDINAAETQAQTASRMQSIRQSGRAEFDSSCKRRDGAVVPVRVSSTFSDTGGGRFFNFVADMSERSSEQARIARANRAFSVLNQCNRAMQQAGNEDELLARFCDIIVKEGGYCFAWVGYAENGAERRVRPLAHAGRENGYLADAEATWGQDAEQGFDPTGTAIRTGTAVFAEDIQYDPMFAPWRDNAARQGYVSAIVLPLMVEGHATGALNIFSDKPEPFGADELELLTRLSDNLAFSIDAMRQRAENHIAWAQVRRLAHYDPLTGIPNRSLFFDRLHQALATAKRERKRMAVMFVDLDEFKEVNDELGHNIGDSLLKATARRIQDILRESDTVARFGGDEFMILLAAIESPDNAQQVAEKLRAAIYKPCELGGHALTISCSIGVAVYPDSGPDEKSLLRCANNAMYSAKSAGRNQVRMHDPVRDQ